MDLSSWYCVHIFCSSFWERKNVKDIKQFVQDLILLSRLYIHMRTVYTYTNTYMPTFSLSGYFGPSRCRVATPGLISEYHTCSVCVYLRIHILNTNIHFYPRQKIEENTDNTCIFPHVENNPPARQRQVLCCGFLPRTFRISRTGPDNRTATG